MQSTSNRVGLARRYLSTSQTAIVRRLSRQWGRLAATCMTHSARRWPGSACRRRRQSPAAHRSEAAATLLARVVAEARASTVTARRTGRSVPTCLEELGLVAALEERARQLSRPGGVRHRAALHVPDAPFAPAEVAVPHRGEALTVAFRHSVPPLLPGAHPADARWATKTVTASPAQLRGDRHRTMRERARELGGRLTIEAADGAGGRVVAELPTLRGG